jgi:Fe-S-cluster containining protein
MTVTSEREKTCMSCAACCKPTEMLLSPADLARIVAKGHDLAACTIPSRQHPHLRELKSTGNRCFFLNGKEPIGPFSCVLYPDHPSGCKSYPLIYDVDTGKAILDKKYCMYWKLFLDMASDPARRDALFRVLHDEMHVV